MLSAIRKDNYHFWWKIHYSKLLYTATVIKVSGHYKKERDNLLRWE